MVCRQNGSYFSVLIGETLDRPGKICQLTEIGNTTLGVPRPKSQHTSTNAHGSKLVNRPMVEA
jgi:hypothetical protein